MKKKYCFDRINANIANDEALNYPLNKNELNCQLISILYLYIFSFCIENDDFSRATAVDAIFLLC